MEYDAFSAGVSLGGLRSKDDIKLLICYILSNVERSLSRSDILSALMQNNLANYFEINNAFSDLIENENIVEDPQNPNLYTVTESGQVISAQLHSSLPISIRDKALKAALNLLSKVKRETENNALICKVDSGYNLKCNISGGNIDLLSFSLYVPDKLQADFVKENFLKDPNIIYECMLALLTQDKVLAEKILCELKNKD
ncbi:MAG: DUF4364 family protein [Clostridia bacterium]|nr:DUF4364 family protein [Clostridia bacterium]